jgi:hypothetical protein
MIRLRTAFLCLLVTRAASAAWVTNDAGECVREWTPASLARGPAAIVNAPLLPFRSAVGGALLAGSDRTPNPSWPHRILLPPLLTIVGGGMGLVEAGIWLGTGLADTITGGWFEIAPDEATHLAITPIAPAFSDTRPAPAPRCGRA